MGVYIGGLWYVSMVRAYDSMIYDDLRVNYFIMLSYIIIYL